MDRFSCGYCGSAQIVKRQGGTVVLKLIGEAIARVQAGTDKTAAELAIVRLTREIGEAEAERARFVFSAAPKPMKWEDVKAIFGGVVVMGLMFCGLWASGGWWAIGLVVFLVAAAFGVLFATNRPSVTAKTAAKQQCEYLTMLDKRIADCRAKIAEHRKVVG